MADPDFTLSDGRGRQWKFTLENGARSVRQNTISEDRGALFIPAQGKTQIGDFDEQRNWKAGHAHEDFSTQPEGFYDSRDAWTLNKNLFHNGLQWQFADGLRKNDTALYGSFRWHRLFPGTGYGYYISTAFVASQSYNADKALFWVRKIGTPGILTLELCSNNAGDPGTVLKTVTIAATAGDVVMRLIEFDFTGTQALVAGTTYHVKLYSTTTDRADNCWEVATDASGTITGKTSSNNSTWVGFTYGLFYRVVDADISRRFWAFRYQGLTYAVSGNSDGSASKLYINGDRGKATAATSTTLTNSNKSAVWVASNWIGAKIKIVSGTGNKQVRTITANTTTQVTVDRAWDVTPNTTSQYIIYQTRTFIEVTSTGLGEVVDRPAVINGIVYFPQEPGTNIRRMRFNASASPPAHEFADDGSNKGYFLAVGDDAQLGEVIWRGLSGNVGRSPKKDWGTALVFTAVTLPGDPEYAAINGMAWGGRKLWVVKDDRIISISGITPTLENAELESTPSNLNGRAIAYMGQMLYFSRLHSVMRLYGGSADDIGVSWRGTELPEERQGTFAGFETAVGWLFAAMDGGTTNTSSVRVYDGLNWHELLTGYAAGKRIRDVSWQPMEDTYYRLWVDIGGDMIYVDFPPYTNVPSQSTQARYMAESVLVSSTIDMGSAARLPKFLKTLAAFTKNLGDGKYIGVDVQFDDDIGTSTWLPLHPFRVSPQDETTVNVGDVRKFRYRLRLNTNSNTTPVIVYSMVPNGFARTPWKLSWSVSVKAGELTYGSRPGNPGEMVKWLTAASRAPGRIRMRSKKYPEMNNYWVTVTPPTTLPERPAQNGAPWQGNITFTINEV